MNEDKQRRMLFVANVSREHIRKFHIPFINYMRQREWRVDVACRLDEPIPECDCAFDLPCDRNPFRAKLWKTAHVLREIIVRGEYDVVVCNTLTGSIITRLARFIMGQTPLDAPPVIYINHGLHYFKGAPLHRWIMGYPVERLLAPLCDVFVAINDEDFDMAKRTLRVGRIEKLDGIGVELDRFSGVTLSADERDEIRKSLGFSSDDTVVVYTAEINRNKNQKMLLRVMRELTKTLPTARLLLVGPEHDSGKLRRLAEKMKLSGSVVFAGWRSDVPRVLAASDLYAASSLSEGLPVNLLEAMAASLPVTAVQNRGHSALIRDGENGYLVDRRDVRTMAERLEMLARNKAERERISDAARRDIAGYDINAVMREEERIVCSVMGDKVRKTAR